MAKFINNLFDFTFSRHSSLGERFIGLFAIGLTSAVVVLLMIIGYSLINKSSSDIYQSNGVVCSSKYVSEHMETAIFSTGKITVRKPVHVDDAWTLGVITPDGYAKTSVTQEMYNKIQIHDSVILRYSKGVLNKNNILIKSIKKLNSKN